MQSALRATMLFSYVSNEDMIIEVSRQELLQANIDRLLQAARRNLPTGIADAAVLKIQRRWVANSLPNHELIYALTYAYAQLHQVCSSLATHLNSALDSSVPHPTSIDPSSSDAARVRFLKLTKPGVGRHASIRIDSDPAFKPPPELLRLKKEFQSTPKPSCLAEVVAKHAKMAQVTFEQHGSHVPMLALYDAEWNQIDFVSAAFTDQAEKFLFWRNVADRAFYLKAFALVWTCESWVRDLKNHENRRVQELPIKGEQLHVVGADASDATEVVAWNISRPGSTSHPVLTPLKPEDVYGQSGNIFFIKPVVAAMKMTHAHNAG